MANYKELADYLYQAANDDPKVVEVIATLRKVEMHEQIKEEALLPPLPEDSKDDWMLHASLLATAIADIYSEGKGSAHGEQP